MLLNVFGITLVAFSAFAQTKPQTRLQPMSSRLDPASHSITTTLVNLSEKKVVAYVVQVRQLDASGKPIGSPLIVGTDHVFSLIYGENAPGLIGPGKEVPQQFGSLSPDSVSAEASVIAIIYLDRSAEGDPDEIAMLRKNRAMHARHAQAVADLLAEYPSSPTEKQLRLSRITSIHERTGAVEELLRGDESLDKARWDAAAAQQRAFANILSSQSKAPE